MSHMNFLQLAKKPDVNDATAMAEWTAQKWIWVKSDDEKVLFEAANIVEDKGDSYEVKTSGGNKVVQKNDTFKMNPPKFEKVEDMAELAYLNEPSVVENLRQRYYSNLIYTYSGLFCVVVNPYKALPIYTDEVVEMYTGKRRAEVPPHVFNIADNAYRNMLHNKENQSILVTGESGAGKTENTKKVIQYLANIASGESETQGKLEQQLLQANPILEAFGNAKTNKNDNSSRFGKFIKIEFDRSGYICGGNVVTYLLEKSRSVRQGPGERNFHIFYQLAAALDAQTKDELMFDELEEISWISDKDASTVHGLNDVKEFTDTVKAMDVIGITKDEQKDIWRVLAGIQKMSKMTFTQNRQDQAQMTDDTAANMLCKLFSLPAVDFTKALLKPRLKVGTDYVIKAQRQDQVEAAVEAICKATYERLFNYIVKKVNNALDNRAAHNFFIGILDIAGFEIFKENGFDQLCINFTNEKLQQFFNHHMFTVEQEEYRREGIKWDFIDFGLDLEPQIKLIEGNKAAKQSGVLDLLDDACHLLPRSCDKSFIQKLDKEQADHKKYSSLSGPKAIKSDTVGFKIHHYAGEVSYTVDGWLVKNSDPLNDNLTALFGNSSFTLLKTLYADLGTSAYKGRSRRGALRTVAYTYRDQLNSLMNTLRETQPSFVRCIIPNHQKKAGSLDLPIVIDQLRCNGVLEGIRICRQGFPNRVMFAEFKQRYEILTPNIVPKGFMDGRKSCEMMLEELGKTMDLKGDQYRIGTSKIFFRTGVLGQLEEARDEKLTAILRNIQARALGYLSRRSYQRLTNFEVAVKRIQMNVRKYLVLRKWPWWFVYNSVRVLIPSKAADDMIGKVKDLTSKNDQLCEENKALQAQKEGLENEKHGLKTQIDELENDINVCNEQIDRLVAKNEETLKEMEDLENEIREAEDRASQANRDKFELVEKFEASQDELSDAKSKLETITADRDCLKAKFDAVSSELDEHKDSNLKLTKEKSSLEAHLSEVTAQFNSAEEKLKKIEKNSGKLGETLAETEEKLQKVEASKSKLDQEKRALLTEQTELNDTISDLKSRVAELESELKKAHDEIASKNEEIEEKNREISQLKSQNRDFSSQIEDLNDQLQERNVSVEKYKKEIGNAERRIEELNEEMFKGDEEKLGQVKGKQIEIDALKREMAQAKEEADAQFTSTKKSLTDKIILLETDLDGAQSAKKEADRNIKDLRDQLAELQETLEKADGDAKKNDRSTRQLHDQLRTANTTLAEKEALLADAEGLVQKLKSDLTKAQSALDEKENDLVQLEKTNKVNAENAQEFEAKYEAENREKLNLKSAVRLAEEEADSLREELSATQEDVDNEKRTIAGLNIQISEMKNKLANHDEFTEEMEASKSKLKREIEDVTEQMEKAQRDAKNHKSTAERLQREKDDLDAELSELRNSSSKAINKARKLESEVNQLRIETDQARMEAEDANRLNGENSAKLFEAKREIESLEDTNKSLKTKVSTLSDECDSLRSTGGDVASLKSEIQSLKSLLNEKDIEVNELNDDLIAVEDGKSRVEVELSNLKNKLNQANLQIEQTAEDIQAQMNKKLRDLQDELEDVERSKSQSSSKAQQLQNENHALSSQIDDLERTRNLAQDAQRRAEQASRQAIQELEELRLSGGDFANRVRELESKNKSYSSQIGQLQADNDRLERSRRSAEQQRDEFSSASDSAKSQNTMLSDRVRRLENELDSLKEEMENQNEEFEDAMGSRAKLSAELDLLKNESSQAILRADAAEKKAQDIQRKSNEQIESAIGAAEDGKRRANQALQQAQSRLSQLEADYEDARRAADDSNRKLKRAERKVRETQNELTENQSQLNDARSVSDRMTSKSKNLARQVEEAESESANLRSRMRRLQNEIEEKDDQINELNNQLRKVRISSRTNRSKLATDDADLDESLVV